MNWHNSNLSRLLRCGESFRRNEIEKDYEPTSPNAIRGSAVHHVARIALNRKKTAGNDNLALPSAEEARDLAADDFEKRWEAADLRLMDEEEDGGESLAQARATSKDVAVALAGYHVGAVAPDLTVVAVERRIEVRPRNASIVVYGTLDLVTSETAPAETSREFIRDLKTGTKAPSKRAATDSQQLSFYALIRRAETGKLVDGLALDHIYKTPGRGDLKHVEQRTTRDDADFEALVNRINTATRSVEAGVFLPASADSWFCSAKWCGYHSTCPFVRRGKRPTS